MKPEAGLVIDGRFRLLNLVGVGAFGSLWRAADRIPGKQVAIRIIGDPKLDVEALDASDARWSWRLQCATDRSRASKVRAGTRTVECG
jgi:hypothetical protein